MPIDVIYQIIFATSLGALIGLERELKNRQAGLQTYSLTALGAALFAIIGTNIVEEFGTGDPMRVIQAVALGIGFIGAGVIMQRKSESGEKVEGLTTAAGLWVTAAIGIAVGMGLYAIAVASTLAVLAILAGFGFIEYKSFNKK